MQLLCQPTAPLNSMVAEQAFAEQLMAFPLEASSQTSTIAPAKRPQWHTFACLSAACRGTVTVVARISAIFVVHAAVSY
jgi:hypothetical protein